MPKSHTSYPPEFRQRMIEFVRSGRSPDELTEKFEPTPVDPQLGRAGRPLLGRRQDGLTTEGREELKRLWYPLGLRVVFPRFLDSSTR